MTLVNTRTAAGRSLTRQRARLPANYNPADAPKVMSLNPSGISILPDRMRALRPDKVDALAESIKQQGLLQSIVVRPRRGGGLGYILVVGRHRLEAIRRLGRDSIRAEIRDLDDDEAKLVEIDENLIRADLTPAERALHIARRKELYEQQHPKTKRPAGPGRGKQNRSQIESGFVKDTSAKTRRGRSTVARDVTRANKVPVLKQIVGTTLDKGDEIDALAKLPEDEQRKLAERAKSGERVSAKVRFKQVRRAERERELAQKTVAAARRLGQEPAASVIVIDWALKYETWSEKGQDRSAENHYPCGTVDQMAALKPPMADDAVIYAWTTSPQLENARKIAVERWGLTYKGFHGWDKQIKGTGHWNRSELELILVFTKGKHVPPAPGEQMPHLFRSRRRGHSEKPEEFYQAIERLYPNLLKQGLVMEMFARKPRPGWRTWGNESAGLGGD
jgi:N6-adenosine-specific RNA methylase IME4/ParB-like chromosome segregation protein Spo0J